MPREGSVAGHFSRAHACSCEIVRGVAINASGFRTTHALSEGACCAHCVEEGGCAAWTWTPLAGDHGAFDTAVVPSGGECALQRHNVVLRPLRGAGEIKLSARAVSGRLILRRSVLFIHHHPPHVQLGCDRRLLALLEQLQLDGWTPVYAGTSALDPGPVLGRTELARLRVPLLAPIDSPQARR